MDRSALTEGELHSQNLRSVRKWIEDNKARIKARPNETVLYSGRIYDLDVLPDLPKEDREQFKGTPVWMSIEKHRKLRREQHFGKLEQHKVLLRKELDEETAQLRKPGRR